MNLDEWLALLERRHPRGIDLGLDRVAAVWHALGAPAPAPRVITVGGTNGKGSTVAFIEAAARALGWRVGAYTSPHLLRYNERIRIDGQVQDDAAIVAAFERIEAARGDISLSYFEFGTLAALLCMADAGLDLAVLEVGLGGRLDAVNIIDADVAVVTTVALDHQDWLGDSRAAIGREKAAIARAGRPFIVGEHQAEPALLAVVDALGANIVRLGREFDLHRDSEGGWAVRGLRRDIDVRLPTPLPLAAPVQYDNAASALAALCWLDAGIDPIRAAAGLAGARLPGRLQRIAVSPDVLVDVGHNPQAAQVLAGWLVGQGGAPVTDVVFSALGDKDIAGIVEPLRPHVRHWHLAGLATLSPRGLSAQALADRLKGLIEPGRIQSHVDVATALRAAREHAGPAGRVLVFGSFLTVAAALEALDGRA